MGDTKYLSIESISKENTGGKVTLTASLCSSEGIRADLWYSFDREFDDAVCDDRCDAVVTTLLLAAMKFGYEELRCHYPISRKLYYNLTYHVIPQLYHGGNALSRIRIAAPLTDTVFHGDIVAAGMSRGVDSFATMYEYGPDFELLDYRINAFTYFQAGAHHGWDATVGRVQAGALCPPDGTYPGVLPEVRLSTDRGGLQHRRYPSGPAAVQGVVL